MNDFLRLLISLALSGAVLTGFVALLNRLLKGRVPHSFRYYLWLLVLLRFLCPFGTEHSLANRVVSQPAVILAEEAWAAAAGEAEQNAPEAGEADAASGGERTVLQTETALPSTLLLLWAAGAVLALGVRLIGYTSARRQLAAGAQAVEPWEQALFQRLTGERQSAPRLLRSAGTDTPVLVGLLRPRIYLPPARMTAQDLQYALDHELVHWRRNDLLYKWVLVLSACVYWFNPAVWYLVRAVERDCELSCDEAVVRGLTQAERACYGAMLLETAACQSRRSGVLSAPLWSQKNDLKERLYGIMKPTLNSKKAKGLLAAAVVLVATTSVALGAYAGQAAKTGTASLEAEKAAGPQAEEGSAADIGGSLVSALAAEEGLSWPFAVDGDIILSALYGERVHPLTGETISHTGIDIPLEQGTPVLAAAPGLVMMAEYDVTGSDLGNCVVISHGTTVTVYGNLEEMDVSEGETVSAGQQIGTAGMTGAATGPHLHFEVQVDGSCVDPLDYLPKEAVYAKHGGQVSALEF